MKPITIQRGWLIENDWIKHLPSDNYHPRSNNDISLLVIHHISLPPHQFGGNDIANFFTNRLDTQQHPFYQSLVGIRVSAHVLIRRNGSMIQFVSFDDCAWHAGKSCYQGREACNEFSIGIELEGDSLSPYRYGQYLSLIALTTTLKQNYPLIQKHIVGHEDIAPIRKTDPGPTFDWKRYLDAL